MKNPRFPGIFFACLVRVPAIGMLGEMASAVISTQEEVLELIDRKSLYGRGCGFVDLNVLASALLGGDVKIWTLDKRLDLLCAELELDYRPSLQS